MTIPGTVRRVGNQASTGEPGNGPVQPQIEPGVDLTISNMAFAGSSDPPDIPSRVRTIEMAASSTFRICKTIEINGGDTLPLSQLQRSALGTRLRIRTWTTRFRGSSQRLPTMH